MSIEEKADRLQESRIVSRQKYLVKREDKKVAELIDTIEDEQLLFKDVQLTERERRDFKVSCVPDRVFFFANFERQSFLHRQLQN